MNPDMNARTPLGALMNLPAEAQLIAGDDGLSLITVTREHDDRLRIDRYPLGQSITLPAFYKLLDTVGLFPRVETPTLLAPPKPEAPVQPVMPAPDPASLACPECGEPFQRLAGLAIHRRKKHGVIGGTARASEANGKAAAIEQPAKPAPTHLDKQIDALQRDLQRRRAAGVDDAELSEDRKILARLVQRRVEARKQARAS